VINDPAEQDADDADTDGPQTDTDDPVRTPSQSRSPSVHPADDTVDVFDGYSFKGRHSVLLDDDDDGELSSGEETEEDAPAAPVVEIGGAGEPEEAVEEEEPKTPEARPTVLPEVPAVEQAHAQEAATEPATVEPATTEDTSSAPEEELQPESEPESKVAEAVTAEAPKPVEEAPKAVEEQPKPALAVDTSAPKAPEDIPLPPDDMSSPLGVPTAVETLVTPVTAKAKPADTKPEPTRAASPKEVVDEHRESLDLVPPMAPPKGTVRINGRTGRPKREKSGVPALDKDRFLSEDEHATELEEDDWDFVEAGPTEERNGQKATSLFARGVVDRYRLSVFRKGATPQRTVSGSPSFASSADGVESPSPSAKQRRGRNPGLTFRRHPKEFLRGKSPPPASASSSRTRLSAQTLHAAGALSPAASTSSALGTPSPSLGAGSPSLRTKESTLSVATTPSMSSEHSVDSAGHDARDATVRSPEEPSKKKALKKYKEGAEKVLALFSSPR
jgi:serum/glucocorticoid-regulated kinase 2